MIDEEFKKQIANDPKLNRLLQSIRHELGEKGYNRHQTLAQTLKLVEANEVVLRDFLLNPKSCGHGPLASCQQPNVGFENQISYHHGKFYLDLTHCNHWKLAHRQELRQKYLIYTDYNLEGFPEDLPVALKLLDDSQSKVTPLTNQRRHLFCNQVWQRLTENAPIGFYLFGPPEWGKSFLFQLLVNCWVAQEQSKVALVRTTSLVNECRNLIQKKAIDKYRKLVSTFKKVDVLFLDEFGSESISRWSRDELLFEILNYRCEQKKLTFINSNFSFNQLSQHYFIAKENKNFEHIKIKRFLSRIRRLTQEWPLASYKI